MQYVFIKNTTASGNTNEPMPQSPSAAFLEIVFNRPKSTQGVTFFPFTRISFGLGKLNKNGNEITGGNKVLIFGMNEAASYTGF